MVTEVVKICDPVSRRVTVPLDAGATSATMERLMKDDADLPFCELPRVNPAYKVPEQACTTPVQQNACYWPQVCLLLLVQWGRKGLFQ